jgi:hypothetical protein
MDISSSERDRLELAHEARLLTGPNTVKPIPVAVWPGEQRYVDQESALKTAFAELSADKGLRRRTIEYRELRGTWEVYGPALASAGISLDEFFEGGIEPLTQFLTDVPTRWLDVQLTQLRHDNPQLKIETNDLTDITALSTAVVYCDVVVTERLWADLINRTDAPKRHNTRVLADLRGLPSALIEAAV